MIKNPYAKRHRLRKIRGETAYVSAHSAALHLDALLGAGWSLRSIAGEAGVPVTTLSKIRRGGQLTALPETVAAIEGVEVDVIARRTAKEGADPFVSRVGTVRRLQGLLFMGWGHQQMRERCGLNTSALLHQQGRWVTRSTHDKVAAMYRDLSHQRGPSTKASAWAHKLGYAGPAAWDDIDRDPSPEPDEEWAE